MHVWINPCSLSPLWGEEGGTAEGPSSSFPTPSSCSKSVLPLGSGAFLALTHCAGPSEPVLNVCCGLNVCVPPDLCGNPHAQSDGAFGP